MKAELGEITNLPVICPRLPRRPQKFSRCGIPREELQQRTRLSNSGTFSAYLRDLKTARLIELGSGGVAASRETLLL